MAATESAARAAKDAHSAKLLGLPGVNGVGVERDANGGFVVAVHLSAGDACSSLDIPSELDGVPVRLACGEPFAKFSDGSNR